MRLDVNVDAALARVLARDDGAHLTDDLAATRRVIDAYREHVLPVRDADLVIDTDATTIDDAVASIAALRGRGAPGTRVPPA